MIYMPAGSLLTLVLSLCSLYRLSAQPVYWENLEEMPESIGFSTGVELDGKIYIIGGFHGDDYNATSSVLTYDPESGLYETEIANLPIPLARASATEIGGKIYVTGGHSFDMGDNALNHLFVYEPEYNIWVEKMPMSKARFNHTSVNLDGKLVVLGGRSRPWPMWPENSVEIYDPLCDKWESLPSMNYFPENASAEVFNEIIYVFGGRYLTKVYNNVEAYDRATNNWTSLNELPDGRWGNGSAIVDDELYLFGGANEEGTIANTWKWDFQNDWEITDIKVVHENATFAYATSLDCEGRPNIYALGGTRKEYWELNSSGPYTMNVAQKYCPEEYINLSDKKFQKENRLTVYPNPAGNNDVIKLDFSSTGKVQFHLIDSQGVTVDVQEYYLGSSFQHQINVSTEKLQPGIYLLNYMTESYAGTKKLIIH